MIGQYYQADKYGIVYLITGLRCLRRFPNRKLYRLPSLIMDETFSLQNLREEVTCSVCLATFTNPKQLPCLHSFCLECLKRLIRTSFRRDVLECPECRRKSPAPRGENLNDLLPNDVRINNMLEVLAIKENNTKRVECGYCQKRSAQSFYCFQCYVIFCDECVTSHNILRKNTEHRVLAIKDFQDRDFESVLKRPAFCQERHHEREKLQFFCHVCETAICQICSVINHSGHAKELFPERGKLKGKFVVKIQKQRATKEKQNH